MTELLGGGPAATADPPAARTEAGDLPPAPITSLDGTAEARGHSSTLEGAPSRHRGRELPASRQRAGWTSVVEPEVDAAAGPVARGRSRRRRRHRVRTKPWRTVLVALAALLVAAALPLLGWKAARTIANSREGKAVEAGPPVGRLPSTPAALLVALDDAGAPAGLTVLSVAADGRGGTAVVVPLGTAAYLDGLAKPVRVDSAFKDGGLDAQTRAVESVLGISTTTSQAVNEDQLASLLAPYAPVEVTFDTPVLETASNGATREVLSAGEHRLTARQAAQAAARQGGRRE